MKRNRRISLLLFVVVSAVMLTVPGMMIYNSVRAEMVGEEFKFRIAPRDPVDFLRGRYLRLNVQPEQAKAGPGFADGRGSGLGFATLETDDEGYAAVTLVTLAPPKEKPYVRVETRSWYRTDDSEISINFPFSRYYMNENKARVAETWLVKHGADKTIHVTVRVHNGYAAVVGLYVDGKPIEEVIVE
ncbi:MAG: GDYXXLXY domain-containing protein [Phycisphaerales bacterium]|jgi:uncharacterized membrane-anchored protein|nr:GDYXXLXY domain-containing protein [Phycisphaerales bacterium]MBT7171653.1 GDYXXLXY domain-containing protein [Phycisphaerales bacterium]